MVHLIWATGGTLLAGLVGLLAYWRGGPPERWGAVILLTGWALSPLLDTPGSVKIGLMALDSCVMLGFILLSLKYRKLWTLLAAAFFVNEFATYMLGFLPGIDGWSYVTQLGLWGGWAPLLALLGGIVMRRQDAPA